MINLKKLGYKVDRRKKSHRGIIARLEKKIISLQKKGLRFSSIKKSKLRKKTFSKEILTPKGVFLPKGQKLVKKRGKIIIEVGEIKYEYKDINILDVVSGKIYLDDDSLFKVANGRHQSLELFHGLDFYRYLSKLKKKNKQLDDDEFNSIFKLVKVTRK